MSDWPKYESHKIVQAAKIVSINDDNGEGENFFWVDPGTGTWEKFSPTEPGMFKRAGVGDWAMLYPDGFRSVSPAKAFEEGYKPVEANAAQLGASVKAPGLAGP